MRYSILFILFFLLSCNSIKYNDKKKETFSGKGFAYIYNQGDYENKIIKFKVDNEKIFVGHNSLKTGTALILINPENNKKINTQVSKKIEYPDFYKILITKKIASFLELDEKAPFIEIVEIKKNKSFIAKKAEMHAEEKQVPNKAPVEKVKISNLGKKSIKKLEGKPKFVIILGNFYSLKSAQNLKKRIYSESQLLKNKKISIKKINDNNYEVFLGPYYTINIIKNDYIALKQINFEEIDVKIIK